MKHIFLTLILLALPLYAQPIVSPEVQSDGRVTFRLKAPNAKEVRIHCEGVPYSPMQRNDQGIWTFTTEPLAPDIYVYSFNVDDIRVVDPANPLLKYNLLNTESQVHVPGPNSLLWEVNDVPHGELHQHFYRSEIAGDDRNFIVYTPPDYDPTARKRYPTLYLLHGFSDDTTAWSSVGRANIILDNLIARGLAKPMVVVMPSGYGTMDILKPGSSSNQDIRKQNLNKFQGALLEEVMPEVEKQYRVSKERDLRAIAGLSMGGAESLVTGLNHLDRFAWIGAFSSGGVNTNYASQFPDLNSGANRKIHLLWIACGKDDRLLEPNQRFCDWLTSENVRYTWVESEGAHSFLVWRRDLSQFTPLLFR